MLARRTLRTLSVIVVLVLIALLGITLGAAAASASANDIPGQWNKNDGRHTSVTLAANGDGRTFALNTTTNGTRWANPSARVTMTSYTRTGQKLWTVDKRAVPTEGLRTGSYNIDRQRQRVGHIIQACVTWVFRVEDDKTLCVKNRV